MRYSTSSCSSCTSKNRRLPDDYKKRKRQNSWRRRKQEKIDFLLEYFKQNPCIRCGEEFPLLLDFDHIVGNKFKSVSTLLGSYSLDRAKQEIKKCQVLCGNCHRKKTKKERIDNGLIFAYKNTITPTNKQKIQLRLRKYVEKYLNANGCVDCNVADIDVLEFDHVRGKKFKSISKLVAQRYSLDVLTTEIQKCDVVCVNCHRMRSAIRGNWMILEYQKA